MTGLLAVYVVVHDWQVVETQQHLRQHKSMLGTLPANLKGQKMKFYLNLLKDQGRLEEITLPPVCSDVQKLLRKLM